MTAKNKKLIIVGASAFAEIAYEYFSFDSDYEVAGFSVEQAYLSRSKLCGLPVVPFETLETVFAPETHEVFVAVTYLQLNRLRTRLATAAKHKGYRLASYISSQAFVWRNVQVGEHCFVFEHNTVQPFVTLGNNIVLWSGNHIGHHSVIRDNGFISSQVVISGFCDIGENVFLGVNATVSNNITIARDCWIGPAVIIRRDTQPGGLYRDNDKPSKISSLKFFKLPAEVNK